MENLKKIVNIPFHLLEALKNFDQKELKKLLPKVNLAPPIKKKIDWAKIKRKMAGFFKKLFKKSKVYVPRPGTRFHTFTSLNLVNKIKVNFGPLLNLQIPKINLAQSQYPIVQCSTTVRYFLRPTVLINKEKLKFCVRISKQVRRFNINQFSTYLDDIKTSLITLSNLKQTFYCSICDADQHQMFDKKRKIVIYSQEFCKDILKEFKDYIRWKNILFMSYLDKIMNLVHCATSSGAINLPFKILTTPFRRRIPFIKRCYKHLDEPDFYKYCRFICIQYKVNEFSHFFEGDINFMKKIYTKLVSFFRKYNRSQQVDYRTLRGKTS